MNLPYFVMLVGLPASGKSTYAQELAEKLKANIHSSDAIREELSGDVNNQNINDLVFKTLHRRVKEDLSNGISCIYDATNISYKRRMAFLAELKNIPCKKICVLMATPYEECLKRNIERDRKVSEEVIERMYKHFDVPYWYEGWDDIIIYYADNTESMFNVGGWLNDVSEYNQYNSHHKLSLGEHCYQTSLLINNYAYQCGMFDSYEKLIHTAMIHDCGKPSTQTFQNSKGEITEQAHYYNHERVGSYQSLFFNTACNKLDIAVLIRWHMQMYFIKEEKTLNKYKKLWGEELYQDLLILHEADKNAH